MENTVKILEYNTHQEKMTLPEYGRGVQKMVENIKTIEDKARRSEQARAVVRVMEILNPSVHSQENWEQVLWDHLFIIADYDLDIDAPYPVPERKELRKKPETPPIVKKKLKAAHYGRNIESIIELIAAREDSEEKTQMIKDLATYMRTQYLIWNKDSVRDETIFQDIEKLSDGRIVVPEGLELAPVSRQASFARPGMKAPNPQQGGGQGQKNRQGRKNPHRPHPKQ